MSPDPGARIVAVGIASTRPVETIALDQCGRRARSSLLLPRGCGGPGQPGNATAATSASAIGLVHDGQLLRHARDRQLRRHC